MSGIFSGKVFLIVTGASRGIGKHIAEAVAAQLESKSNVLLLARNEESLNNIAAELPKGLVVSYQSVDFSTANTDQLQKVISDSLKNEKPENFDKAIIVHNAAMATFSQLTTELTDFNDWHTCYHLNTFSPAVLNGIFMNTFSNKSIKKYVINISSYWGIKPDIYVGSYCSAKAAKDMFFKVFALENPDVNVVNYLPGYVETDMFYDALKSSNNEKLKAELKDMIENKKFVTPPQTAKMLVEVLKNQKYNSGDYVNYYDLV